MQVQISLRVSPHSASDDYLLKTAIALQTGHPIASVTGYRLLRSSVDARSKSQIWYNLTLIAFINEPYFPYTPLVISYPELSPQSKSIIIAGAGPAGLFAALQLIRLGIRPIVLERGKEVRSRRRDLAAMNKMGLVNPESNYCFGEGGAGTYSDGKLYTRSTKRGPVEEILNTFVQFGAEEKILYESHPHIGTNKLPQIIEAMRRQILNSGGQIRFNTRLSGLQIQQGRLRSISTDTGEELPCAALILATGHSASDIFELLQRENIAIEAKPFALGVRIEHPQKVIDHIQYHQQPRSAYLPPASYSLVAQVAGKGVFSFCMCPGGIIAPASTAPGRIVVNGWSPSRRNNPYSNSGMVVAVETADAVAWKAGNAWQRRLSTSEHKNFVGPLSLLHFQQAVEEDCWIAGGGNLQAPAQRMTDFCTGKYSPTLPVCSYLPGLQPALLSDCLPPFIYQRLQQGLKMFGQKMKGYYTEEAVVVATESRTSSPVRIPRNALACHPDISNLFPCGEGAGYAGGIVSAALDGQFVARNAALSLE